ncbi:MAG: LysR family transcriptional regulator [Bdellovibrionales bacterium]|nr:LysR family transcriptional regulator [Bdellovibrionales bacterium]
MEFHDLEVFIVVNREKSFSKTAKKIFRTQPAISLSIKRLEGEIGSPVFDRKTKEPILTDIGKVLLEYAEKLINIRDQIKPKIEEIKNLESGRVRIGANEAGAIFLLPHIVAYRKQYPSIRVEVVRSQSRDIPYEILNRSLDLGIVSYEVKEADIVSSFVYEDRLCLVVYAGHPFAKMKQVPLKRLADENFAAHNVDSRFRDKIFQVFAKENIPLNISVELPTIESVKKFVQMKQALALVPRMCIRSELERKELIEVKVPEIETMHKSLRAVYLKGQGASFAAKAFINLLKTSKRE